MSSWERWIKRYVWDDERTPYLVAPERLTRNQASYEIFAYAVFLGFLFFLASLASASSPLVMLYTLSMVVAGVALALTKHASAATYAATAPVAAALHLAYGGFSDNLGTPDYILLTGLIILWAFYSFRIISVAKAYGDREEEGK